MWREHGFCDVVQLNEVILFLLQHYEKHVKDAKKLIRLLENENTHLKMELQTRLENNHYDMLHNRADFV